MSEPATREDFEAQFLGNLFHDLRVDDIDPEFTMRHWSGDTLNVRVLNKTTGRVVAFDTRWNGAGTLEQKIAAAMRIIQRHTRDKR